MKKLLTATAVLLTLPISAHADDLSHKLLGTYSCNERNFVTVKRLIFDQAKDGSIKVHGALVGFPEEVSIGEATPQPYANRNSTNDPDVMLASFSSEKYKPLMIITPSNWDGSQFKIVFFTCYMRDVDGKNIHITGNLTREP